MSSSQPVSQPTLPPAYCLAGLLLNDGWRVIQRLDPGPNATGGAFSVGYLVENIDGTVGFLKALDFSPALRSNDQLRALQTMLELFNFERDLFTICREKRMSRVATAIADGSVDVPGYGLLSRVHYLIFEKADRDSRAWLDLVPALDLALRIRFLHHVATGLRQLHRQGIAHQDVKPSNVLVFGPVSKISDLGTASRNGRVSPNDAFPFPGDPAYAPIECLYDYCDSDWRRRRFGADLHMLGSLMMFFFTKMVVTSATIAELAPGHQPQKWQGDYQSILPHVRDAFDKVCCAFEQQVSAFGSKEIASELTVLLRYLCDPDPSRRGHPRDRRFPSTQHSLERFISRFDVLSAQATYHAARSR